MYPNAALDEIRKLVKSINSKDPDDEVWRLAEVVEGLDVWLSMGGALPVAWQR